MRTVRVVIALIGIACFVLAAMSVAVAQQNAFSLAPRQSVAVGQYTIRYLGLTSGGWPAYELYVQGGGRLAAFPSSPPPAACCEYLYRNVSIMTTAIAPGGATVAGRQQTENDVEDSDDETTERLVRVGHRDSISCRGE